MRRSSGASPTTAGSRRARTRRRRRAARAASGTGSSPPGRATVGEGVAAGTGASCNAVDDQLGEIGGVLQRGAQGRRPGRGMPSRWYAATTSFSRFWSSGSSCEVAHEHDRRVRGEVLRVSSERARSRPDGDLGAAAERRAPRVRRKRRRSPGRRLLGQREVADERPERRGRRPGRQRLVGHVREDDEPVAPAGSRRRA